MMRPFTRGFASASTQIKDARVRDAVLKGLWKSGPPSIKTRRAKLAYNSPLGLEKVFPLAHEILEKERQKHYDLAEKAPDGSELKRKHLIRAEMHNPEVLYNFRMKTAEVDYDQDVYLYLAEREWRRYDRLIMIQRFETLHVIPDTMPTLDPRASVEIQFSDVQQKWTPQGEFVRNEDCAVRPLIRVRDFKKSNPSKLYTVLIVDPDVPDVENDTFKPVLHMAAVNATIDMKSPILDYSQAQIAAHYLAPHPEMNTPPHRYCVWVFKQSGAITTDKLERDNFDIRDFAKQHGLDPVGGHVWRVKYDDSTPLVREKYGLGPGRVFSRERY